jgi:transposase
MQKIRDIIQLRLTTQMGERQIARALRVSRTVVSKTLAQYRASGLKAEAIGQMSDSALEGALWQRDRVIDTPRYKALEKRFPAMLQELKSRGMTLERLWQQYFEEEGGGYQYSQFCLHFQRWTAAGELWMHQDYKAGERMFADWAGDPLVVVDAATGAEWSLNVYVGILGASGLTYVEASEDEQQPCWIRCNEGALRYFGGRTDAITPDNLKTGVQKADRYEPEINPVFEEFATYYGMVVFPARAGKPRDKALVENAVRLVYQRVYCPLRGKSFRGLAEINKAIRELVEEHNNKPLQRLGISRRELFEATERKALHALPAEPFALKDIQMATVGVNYHVELREDRHYYSVPHYLRTKDPLTEVKIVYDERVVSIYHEHLRITQHRRDRSPNGYTTLSEHMPDSHRWQGEWSAERLTAWAQQIGPDVHDVIVKVLQSRTYPPQAFRACHGILSLSKHYGSPRLNQACRRVLSYGSCSGTKIRTILAHGLEQDSQPGLDLVVVPFVAEHENLRGPAYFN